MIEVYVLNDRMERIAMVDTYTSLIWANRYNETGDCELYIEANSTTLSLLRKGYFLSREDDEMVCRIEKIELNTDTENGNYLTVTGYDVKKILKQRIIWNQTNADGNVEDYLRKIVYDNLVKPSEPFRQIRDADDRANFFLGERQGFPEVTAEQVTYKSVEEKVQETCKKYQWGYKVTVDAGNFYFSLYKGTDRSETVAFSPDFENIVSTKYVDDSSNTANVALVAGEGEGADRFKRTSGVAKGLDRTEIFVDAKDISKTITWGDLTEMYPLRENGGGGYIFKGLTGIMVYQVDVIYIAIVDDVHLALLRREYPGGFPTTKDGNRYYQVEAATVAELTGKNEGDPMEDGDSVVLWDSIYTVYLMNRGYEKLSEYRAVTAFEGRIDPLTTFVYKKDYFLGDVVSVENEFGIHAGARITEVVETFDENGYVVEPRFEFMEVI